MTNNNYSKEEKVSKLDNSTIENKNNLEFKDTDAPKCNKNIIESSLNFDYNSKSISIYIFYSI